MAYERRPWDEPDNPEPVQCEPTEDHQGNMTGGCGCTIWRVVTRCGDVVELDSRPLRVRRDLFGDAVRADGDSWCSEEGGYSVEWPPLWTQDALSGVWLWEWYATKQPLEAALRGVRLYGAHKITCAALSMPAKKAWASSLRTTVDSGELPSHREALEAERERMLSVALRTESQNAYREQLGLGFVTPVRIDESDQQLSWKFLQEIEDEERRERQRRELVASQGGSVRCPAMDRPDGSPDTESESGVVENPAA